MGAVASKVCFNDHIINQVLSFLRITVVCYSEDHEIYKYALWAK